MSVAAIMIVLVGSFYGGYMFGKNRTVKRELSVTIPFHVHVYRSIKAGNSNQASGLTAMALRGKIARYASLKKDLGFRITGGAALFESSQLQKYVDEAFEITDAERTNLVTIGAESKK
jgi:hypothetical protein